MTENEHKNMSGNIPEMLVLKWNWRKAKKMWQVCSESKYYSHSSHHNMVKDKVVLKGADIIQLHKCHDVFQFP